MIQTVFSASCGRLSRVVLGGLLLSGLLVGPLGQGGTAAAQSTDQGSIVWQQNPDGTYSGVWSPWATEPEPPTLPSGTGAGTGMGSGGGTGAGAGVGGGMSGAVTQSGEWTVGPWVSPAGQRGCVTFSTAEAKAQDAMALAQVGDDRVMLLRSAAFQGRNGGDFHAQVRIDQGFTRDMTFTVQNGLAWATLTQIRPLVEAFRQGMTLTLSQNGAERARFSLVGSNNSIDLLRHCIRRMK